MGYRTIVMLYNDYSHEWSTNPDLGSKILQASSSTDTRVPGGRVVECCHADQQSLVVVDSYSFDRIASQHWNSHQTTDKRNLEFLRQFAENMGYELVRKG
jgi:hypothetical protein